jgi:hypothetical protein
MFRTIRISEGGLTMFERMKTGLTYALAVLFVLGTSCSTTSDREVATVGENRITVAHVVDVMSSGGYEESEKGAREALEYLIDFQLILLEARAQGLKELPEYDVRMKHARDQLLTRKLMEVEVYEKAIPTEEEIRQVYEERGGDREEVRIRHILVSVPPKATEEEEVEKRKNIEGLLERIRSGEDFATIAREHSDGPSAHRGGDLGFHSREGMDPDFEKAAFDLAVGEVTDIFRTRFGFHIAKMEERRMRLYDDFRDKLAEDMETSRRMTMSKEFMDAVEQRAQMRFDDEGIDRMIALFAEDTSGAMAREEAPILAVYMGGDWTGADFMEFYTLLPESLRVVPDDRNELKAAIAGKVSDAILVNEALGSGIDQREDFLAELAQLEEDILVQMFITHQLFAAEPGEDQLRALYESERERFPGEFEEERENVLGIYRDRMEEGGLENLTEPLREKYSVVIIDDNLQYVPRALRG